MQSQEQYDSLIAERDKLKIQIAKILKVLRVHKRSYTHCAQSSHYMAMLQDILDILHS